MPKLGRSKLLAMYWGENGIPGEWKTVEAIAEATGQSVASISALLTKYKIRRRGVYEDCHLAVWKVLTGDWNMILGGDFLYRTKVNGAKEDFFVVDEMVGLSISVKSHCSLSEECHHIGGAMMFKVILPSDLDPVAMVVDKAIDILKRCDVKKRLVEVSRDSTSVW